MDINLLALNVGNTRIAIGIFSAGTLEHVARVCVDDKTEFAARITEAWDKIKDKDSPAIAGASVNPRVLESLEHAVEQITGAHIEWIGKDVDLPIKVLTKHPEQTGVDRVVNVAAAFEQMQKACVVVDAGTAITVDCCNDAGEFLGGAISPGATMMLEALHEKAARLPKVSLAVPDGSFGLDTQQAILHGVYHGIRGLVKELTENYATALGFWPDLIATGGDAKTLFDGWELIHAISPDLTLYGIALAFTNHHIKHGD